MSNRGHTISSSRRPAIATSIAFTASLWLTACSGGGGDPYTPGTDLPASEQEAMRFLQRATFGPDEASFDRLSYLGYTTFLQEQRELPPSLQEGRLLSLGTNVGQSDRQEIWWRNAVRGRDQLRQRMAFALSQIFVVSDRHDGLDGDPVMLASYYDMLSRHAFSTYRELIEQVTLHPAMGIYLSMLRNRKPDPTRNIRPDENYAREIMQLFSIGLLELEQDGSPRLDTQGQEIPTYSQAEIEGLAHVFTGWNYAGATGWSGATPNRRPMEPNENFHDRNAKLIVGAYLCPSGVDAESELAFVLDRLAAHPNVAPFLGKQLIQRFATSNPSAAYVARVSAVWRDDGNGVRGNLGAVLQAVLTDAEAFDGHVQSPSTFGKLKEGVLMQTAVWRAFAARANNGLYGYSNPETSYGQAALRADSVFNFYRPDHRPQGELTTLALDAPEFQLLDQNTAIASVNQLYRSTIVNWRGRSTPAAGDVLVDVAEPMVLAADPEALIQWLDRWLLASAMPSGLAQILRTHMTQVTDPRRRVTECAWLVAASPQFAVQK
ncbi:MAG: DUF1800 family protein [Planctomycetota bacterium]